jgi:hypothetical protein
MLKHTPESRNVIEQSVLGVRTEKDEERREKVKDKNEKNNTKRYKKTKLGRQTNKKIDREIER